MIGLPLYSQTLTGLTLKYTDYMIERLCLNIYWRSKVELFIGSLLPPFSLGIFFASLRIGSLLPHLAFLCLLIGSPLPHFSLALLCHTSHWLSFASLFIGCPLPFFLLALFCLSSHLLSSA